MTYSKVRLGEVAKIVSGATPKTGVEKFWGGDIYWATPKDLSELETKFISSTPTTITREGYESCSTSLLPSNSVLFSSRAPIGHVALNSVPMAINQGFKSFVPDENLLNSTYLYFWLKAHKEQLQSLGRGATFKEVSKRIVENIEIPLPPLEQQRHIAAVLDKADELRTKRRRGIERLEALLQSVFLEMFVEQVFSNWPTVKAESFVKEGKGNIRTGPFGSQLLHSEFTEDESGVMVLGIDNVVENRFKYGSPRFITHEKYEQLERYTIYPDDVLITIMGTCGRTAIVPEDIPLAINTKHLCCITLDQEKCLPIYLKHCFLLHPVVLEQLGVSERGAVMPGLNMGIIKSLQIPLPPLELQIKYSAISKRLNHQRDILAKSAEELDNLFHSLQQRAFRGELA